MSSAFLAFKYSFPVEEKQNAVFEYLIFFQYLLFKIVYCKLLAIRIIGHPDNRRPTALTLTT